MKHAIGDILNGKSLTLSMTGELRASIDVGNSSDIIIRRATIDMKKRIKQEEQIKMK